MMTEKKVKRHLRRIWSHLDMLQDALNQAHNADVIEYKDYDSEAPCKAMSDLRDRLRVSTMKASAKAIENSVRRKPRY